MAPSKDEVTTFSFKIETIAKTKSISYMEAVIEYCDEIGLEVEIGAKMISGALKSKLLRPSRCYGHNHLSCFE